MKITYFFKLSRLERILIIVNMITVIMFINDKLISNNTNAEISNNEVEELVCPNNYSNAGGGYCSANLCITGRGDRCSYGQQMIPGQVRVRKRKITKEDVMD